MLTGLHPSELFGVPLALAGAVLLSLGAQYQSRGLRKVQRGLEDKASFGLTLKHIGALFGRPSWVLGTLFLGLATLLQLGSLSFSPIVLVQPIGVVALIVTAILNTKFSRVKLGNKAKWAIAYSVLGVTVFVAIAALYTRNTPVTHKQLSTVLVSFAIVFMFVTLGYVLLRQKPVALIFILGAGVLYGFVATLAKVTISTFQQGTVGPLTWLSIAALLAGTLLGMLFVQNAYASGPPDLVVAGLTVIDPLIAVLIGIIILGEAKGAPLVAAVAFVIAGVIAIIGVINLSKHHPQTGMSALAATNTAGIPVIIDEE